MGTPGSSEFESRWNRLSISPIDADWFRSLRRLYEQATAEEHEELTRRLGWSVEFCVPPSDTELFGADWTERVRPKFRDKETLIAHMVHCSRSFWPADYRDQLVDLAGLYHASILAGFDPDRIFQEVAESAAPEVAKYLDQYRLRRDKDLPLFGYEVVRRPNGHVHIMTTAS